MTCKLPGCSNDVYLEKSGRVHDFCGKTHAEAFKAQTQKTTHTANSCFCAFFNHLFVSIQAFFGRFRTSFSSPSSSKVSEIAQCKFPGCKKEVYVEAHGRVHDFCGKTHAKAFSQSTLAKTMERLAKRDGFIYFYNAQTTPITECFGNFYLQPLRYLGRSYKCSEAAFQAQKFTGRPDIQTQFQNLDGDASFRLARNNKQFQDGDWMQRNVQVMLDVLKVKFEDPALKAALLATGSSYLVEHLPIKGRDSFWGDDHDGSGQNMLGKLLMQVRRHYQGHGEQNPPLQYFNFLKNP